MNTLLFILMVIINIIVYRSLKVLRRDKYYYMKNNLKKIYYLSGIFLLFFNMITVKYLTIQNSIVLMWLSTIVVFYFFVKVFLHFVSGHHNHKYSYNDNSYNSNVSHKFMEF